MAQCAAAGFHLHYGLDHLGIHRRLAGYRNDLCPERHPARLYWQALNNTDYELVLAMQMFYTVVSLVGVLLTDLSYGLVDPRVRVNK